MNTGAGDNSDNVNDLVAELGRLGYLEEGNTGRLLGVVMALAGEVFVVRAQQERLMRALQERGAVDAALLDAVGASAGMRQWLEQEEKTFGRSLLQPFLDPDITVNATHHMRSV
ncbi:MAG: hypothetical protein Q7T63_11750 [Burkholderiaceae bacterium]|nr:hypothetical protein [Burkholderiaceae bacterium]MDO9088757.1 hypothetical protein [Burkholderiaceae bacterium]